MNTISRKNASEPSAAGLSGLQTVVMAASAGLSVANIYFAQPLLDLMAKDFGISAAAVGLIVTLTQVGYALGLILIVPIGDLVDRRRLITGQGLLSAIALAAVATAGSKAAFFISMCTMGLLAVLVQVIVGYAAALATPAQRGRVIGMVTSGIVTGILAARSFAGAVADLGGWRTVYATSGAFTLLMVGLVIWLLPRQPAAARSETYVDTLRSMPLLFLGDPALLVRGLLAMLIFASFSTFWTALVLPLSEEPFSYSHTQIGLFGLVGLAGALASSFAGKLADDGHGIRTTSYSLVLLLASWGLIVFLPTSLILLLAGVILLDFAVQAVHVTNLSSIAASNPQKSGRLIGGYMVFYSVGSALGAVVTTRIYAGFGWSGVSFAGAAFSAVALVLWGICLRRSRVDAEASRAEPS